MISLTGKTAIITGGNQGFGRVIAETFLKSGANVVICARDESLLNSAHDELKSLCQSPQQRFDFCKADVSRADEVEKLVQFALSRNERVDILINNAGVYGPKGNIEDVDWQEWTRAVEINLYGPI